MTAPREYTGPVHIWRCNKEEDHEPHITHTDERGQVYQCLGEDVWTVDA